MALLATLRQPLPIRCASRRAEGGKVLVRSTGEFDVERRYLSDTAVLETTFTTGTGTVRLLDLMSVSAEPEKSLELQPAHEVLRVAGGLGLGGRNGVALRELSAVWGIERRLGSQVENPVNDR